jgi:hypothetical protein
MGMNQAPVLSEGSPWPSRPELGTVTVERGQGPITDSDYSIDRWNPGLLQRQTARVEESRSRIREFDNLIVDWKQKITLYEDLKKQEFEKIVNAEALIAKQKALQPVHYQAPVSARKRLLDQISHLYLQSAASGADVTFSVLPSILDAVASDHGIVSNKEFENATNYCRGVFGRATFAGIEITFAEVVARARSLQGKTFNTRRIESGLV